MDTELKWVAMLACAVGILLLLRYIHALRSSPVSRAVQSSASLPQPPGLSVAKDGSAFRLEPLRINPIADLSFEEALDPIAFARACDETLERAIRKSLASHGGDAIAATFQSIVLSDRGLIVTFQHQGYELMRTSDGLFKAVTRDAGGKIVEFGNVDALARWMNGLANTTAIVVSVAHIISGADISKRLAKVELSLDKLLAYRRIDQWAALRTAYEGLREEASRDVIDTHRIYSCRDAIREIRHRLTAESLHDLRLLAPNARRYRPWSQKLRPWRIKPGSKEWKTRESEISMAAGKTILAGHCLRFEQLATSAIDGDAGMTLQLEEAERDFRDIAALFKNLEEDLRRAGPHDLQASVTITLLADVVSTAKEFPIVAAREEDRT